MSIDVLMAKLTASTTWPSENNPQGNAMEEVAFNPKTELDKPIKQRGAMGVATRAKTKGGITALDVSAAIGMAKLPKWGEPLLRAMYCEDGAAAMGLLNSMAFDIEMYQAYNGVNTASIDWCEGCALAVIFPFIWGIRCKPCHSSGVTEEGDTCECCGGSGLGKFSKRSQATKAGIPESTWRRNWSECYTHFRAMLVEVEHQCEGLLIEQLLSRGNLGPI